MKVQVCQDKCIGCGACVAISPSNFDFDDEGMSKVIGEEITDSTRDAVEACPVMAIEIIDEHATDSKKIEDTLSDDEGNNADDLKAIGGTHEVLDDDDDYEDDELKEVA